MGSPLQIDEIINAPSKVAILRIFASRQGFKATGREIAKLSGYSAPATHDSLKDLHARNILTLEIIGKQHIYALNEDDRIVQKIIRPMFEVEKGLKNEMRDFLVKEMERRQIQPAVSSIFLYGSVQKETAKEGSDVDVAVIVNRSVDVAKVADVFLTEIAAGFKLYFGVQLDPYVKSAKEFRERLKKGQPPVSTLMKSYTVLYGKESLEV